MPLHGDLSPRAQDAAVATYPERKIVVSTNVAETSLTIDGVTLVIDSGLAKIAKYDPHRGINTLITEKISRASADQRAGRAGRTAPGRCVRLWSERDQLGRRPQDLPEVKRLDLAEVLLNLKAAGVTDLERFGWIEMPDPNSLRRAIELLEDLGALDRQNGKITVDRTSHALVSGSSAVFPDALDRRRTRLCVDDRAWSPRLPRSGTCSGAAKTTRWSMTGNCCSAKRSSQISSS